MLRAEWSRAAVAEQLLAREQVSVQGQVQLQQVASASQPEQEQTVFPAE